MQILPKTAPLKQTLLSRMDPGKQIRLSIKALLGLDRVSRAFTIYPDDVFLVSYPKSGNTWTRFLIGNLIAQDEPVEFKNVEQKIPIIKTLDYRLRRVARPRILKSHCFFDPLYPKVILIVRDPRDVAVSFYHFGKKIGKISQDCSIEKFVELFIAGRKIDQHGSWGENVGSWIGAREGSPGFMMARYEDLQADTASVLKRIGTFLGLDSTPEKLALAVERSSADRMRKLEKEQFSFLPVKLRAQKDKPFVRTAKSGTWRQELPLHCAAQIESAWPRIMKHLGYLP